MFNNTFFEARVFAFFSLFLFLYRVDYKDFWWCLKLIGWQREPQTFGATCIPRGHDNYSKCEKQRLSYWKHKLVFFDGQYLLKRGFVPVFIVIGFGGHFAVRKRWDLAQYLCQLCNHPQLTSWRHLQSHSGVMGRAGAWSMINKWTIL